jgi:beta-phosphoglucomutase-like phosphatase (HAD superfamily)
MIEAVIFDVYGVLIDADAWHYRALNVALSEIHFSKISSEEGMDVAKRLQPRGG